jgi:three-Cys-motif partner protein
MGPASPCPRVRLLYNYELPRWAKEGGGVAAKDTLWKLEAHSVGKHQVLKRYLDAWFPKLGRWGGRILFIDGFCGPGEYANGEPGSPLVALDAFVSHSGRELIGAEVVFLFGDEDKRRVAHLSTLVQKRHPLPQKMKVSFGCGDFNAMMSATLDKLDTDHKQLAPAFVMLDPFGVSDTPFSLVQRILKYPKSEVYVSFMYESINRFKTRPEFAPHLDELFGTPKWREGWAISSPDDRKAFFYDLYEAQLKAAGAEHVVRFELFNGNRLVYAIFFGTHNWRGADCMKQAIWKVDPFGTFQFRGSRSGELFNSTAAFDPTTLKAVVKSRFDAEWFTIDELEKFVGSDATDFHSKQIKTPLLKPMEASGELEIAASSRNRKGTYPSGTRMRLR